MSDDIVVVGAARTPFGSYGGSLATWSATDLATHAAKAAIERSGVDPERIDEAVIGNVCQTSKDAIYLARHVGLRAGMKTKSPGLIVNLLCGSGAQAVNVAAMLIETGQAEIVLAGGGEALSMTPYSTWSMRWGKRMGHGEFWDGLDIRDTLPDLSMGESAEDLAEPNKITREDQDQLAFESQQKATRAMKAGLHKEEIAPIELTGKKGAKTVLDYDEHIRPEASMEALAKLKPHFRKNGTITAGNASGIVDGGSALVITSGKTASKLNLKPLCRVASWALVGVPPQSMGIGPVEAIPLALAKAGLKQDQMDLFEVNEAFAVQYLACEKQLKLPREKVNVNGGACAIGHPFAATGGRMIHTIALELKRRKARYGMVSMCIGGGMGGAMVIEAL